MRAGDCHRTIFPASLLLRMHMSMHWCNVVFVIAPFHDVYMCVSCSQIVARHGISMHKHQSRCICMRTVCAEGIATLECTPVALWWAHVKLLVPEFRKPPICTLHRRSAHCLMHMYMEKQLATSAQFNCFPNRPGTDSYTCRSMAWPRPNPCADWPRPNAYACLVRKHACANKIMHAHANAQVECAEVDLSPI